MKWKPFVFSWFNIFYQINISQFDNLFIVLRFSGHTDGMWPKMKYMINSDGDRGWHRLMISNCVLVSGVLCAGHTCIDSGYGFGVCLLPGRVPSSQNLSPSLVKMPVRLSLSSGGLFSHSNEIYCVFSDLPSICTFSLPLSLFC